MSISATNAVWKMGALKPIEKLVLLALADYADADGACWPSVRLLAKKTAISERAIQENVKVLAMRKVIKIEARSAESGRTTSNRYIVFPGREEGTGGEGAPGAGGRVRDVRGEGAPGAGGEGAPRADAKTEPLRDESTKRSEDVRKGDQGRSPSAAASIWRGELSGSMRDEFRALYQAYPNKKNPGRAERAYFFARRRATAEVIVAGLVRAIESAEWARVPRDGGSVVPHPATWLNARGWENEYTKQVDEKTGTDAVLDAFVKKGGV